MKKTDVENSRSLFFDKLKADEKKEKIQEKEFHKTKRIIKIKNFFKAFGEFVLKILLSCLLSLIASILATVIITAINEDISLMESLKEIMMKIKDFIC